MMPTREQIERAVANQVRAGLITIEPPVEVTPQFERKIKLREWRKRRKQR